MPATVEAGKLDCAAPGTGVAVTIGEHTVALFKVEGAIIAIEGRCLRCGACIADGCLQGGIVECRGCRWRYEVGTGSVVGIPALRLHTFDTQVVDGQIVVAIT